MAETGEHGGKQARNSVDQCSGTTSHSCDRTHIAERSQATVLGAPLGSRTRRFPSLEARALVIGRDSVV